MKRKLWTIVLMISLALAVVLGARAEGLTLVPDDGPAPEAQVPEVDTALGAPNDGAANEEEEEEGDICEVTLVTNGGYYELDDDEKVTTLKVFCPKGIECNPMEVFPDPKRSGYRYVAGWSLIKGGDPIESCAFQGGETLYTCWERVDIASGDISVEISPKSYVYSGRAKEPSTVRVIYRVDNEEIRLTKAHYTVSYKNNVDAGSGTAQVIVKGRGDFKGTRITYFSIQKAEQAITLSTSSETNEVMEGKTIELNIEGAKGELSYHTKGSDPGKVNVTGKSNKKAEIKGEKAGKVTLTVKSAATNNYKEGSASIEITVKPRPEAPKNLKAENYEKFISLEWKGVNGATYNIYLGNKLLTTQSKTICMVTDSMLEAIGSSLENGKKYTFTVTAVKDGGESKDDTFTKIMRLTPPASAKLAKKLPGQVLASWKANSKAEGYKIQVADNPSFNNAKFYTISKNTTTSKLFTLARKRVWYFRIRAYNGNYYSWWKVIGSVML